MAIIHDGKEIQLDYDILLDKWKSKTVTCEVAAQKPTMCIFNNTRKALEMLNKHIVNNSTIALHTDVDVDGIGTTYILKKALDHIGSVKNMLIINKDKIHGIQEKHVEYFKKRPIDLIIITDSSCNEINIIKEFTCDVLVIDHHELLHNNLNGKCNDGIHDYVIVNNTIDNEDFESDINWLKSKNISAFDNISKYKGTNAMSCGLVVYELLRVYCEVFSNIKIIENLMLYQWAAITLITDVIDTLNERNQWYLDKTFFNMNTETSLKIMMNKINNFKGSLDKSFISYSFAPMINKAIRAGESAKALDIVINHPYDINDLSIYSDIQKEAIDKAVNITEIDEQTGLKTVSKRIFNTKNIIMDIGTLGIHPNYTGVIAGRLSGDNNKNAAIYITDSDGICKGSFRGRYKNVNYRGFFEQYSDDIYAQGHPGAFGFKCKKEQLDTIMNNIEEIEPTDGIKPYITVGDIGIEDYGEYHVTSIDEFKRLGYILKMATGNAKVTSTDEIMLRVKTNTIVLKDTRGKLFLYDVLGMECKAFTPLNSSIMDIYPEFTNEISMYIR